MPKPSCTQISKAEKIIPSPITPAVTGIDYPAQDDTPTDIIPKYIRGTPPKLYTHPNIAASTIEAVDPPAADAVSLTLVWDTIRQQKEKKMEKEKPKVQSLENAVQGMKIGGQVSVPLVESPPVSNPKSLRRQKSISNFRESTDGRAIVATFEFPEEITKHDIHISFQRTKLVLTWEIGEITEWEEEDGVVYREYVRNMYNRILPLPDGTRFEEVQAQMTNRGLILRYPNMRCVRVDSRSRSGDS